MLSRRATHKQLTEAILARAHHAVNGLIP